MQVVNSDLFLMFYLDQTRTFEAVGGFYEHKTIWFVVTIGSQFGVDFRSHVQPGWTGDCQPVFGVLYTKQRPGCQFDARPAELYQQYT